MTSWPYDLELVSLPIASASRMEGIRGALTLSKTGAPRIKPKPCGLLRNLDHHCQPAGAIDLLAIVGDVVVDMTMDEPGPWF